MALSKQPYKGTRDFFPAQMRLRNYIFDKLSEVSEKFSFEPYDGPLLEELDLYRAKSGEELINEQVYNFTDRGGREVAIRPELTPTLARMVSQIHREVSKPLRWYSIPNLMRYEKPQRGRLREFWQYNADIFGAPEGLADVEIIQLAINLIKSFGANNEHFEILINSRKFVDHVFNNMIQIDAAAGHKLYKLVDKKNKMPAEKFTAEVLNITQDAQKSALFEKYVSLTTIEEVKKFCGDEAVTVGLDKLFTKLSQIGFGDYVKFDPSIVRGLDYYTDIVFEVFDKHPDNRRAIAGGGAYANLLAIFGEQPLGGIGFGLGEVPLTDFLTTHKLLGDFSKQDLDLLVGYLDEASEIKAFEISQLLRDQDIKTDLYLGEAKPKKIFQYSDRKDPKFLIMIGSDDLTRNEIQVKNMKDKTSQNFALNNIQEITAYIKGTK